MRFKRYSAKAEQGLFDRIKFWKSLRDDFRIPNRPNRTHSTEQIVGFYPDKICFFRNCTSVEKTKLYDNQKVIFCIFSKPLLHALKARKGTSKYSIWRIFLVFFIKNQLLSFRAEKTVVRIAYSTFNATEGYFHVGSAQEQRGARYLLMPSFWGVFCLVRIAASCDAIFWAIRPALLFFFVEHFVYHKSFSGLFIQIYFFKNLYKID